MSFAWEKAKIVGRYERWIKEATAIWKSNTAINTDEE